jgi:protein farnesyltransferase/geranylgeranyltransferase type-1 subunit alpha
MANTTKTMPTRSKPKSSSKSKDPYYAISPEWSDITPIPLIDGPPPNPGQSTDKDPGPALATIAYSPRYSEAMAYLRAVMAVNEFSHRALDLTEDIIGMNPAHYTVWLYRAKILKVLWEKEGVDAKEGVMQELEWLEGISERNLKNYQIWYVVCCYWLGDGPFSRS